MRKTRYQRLMISLILTSFTLGIQGCGLSKPEVIYAGNVRSTEESVGRLRLAQPEVDVVVDGDERVSKLTNTGNYFVVWVEDLVAAVNAMDLAKKLRTENAELKLKIKQLESR